MELYKAKFELVAAEAKSKAAGNARWLAVIDKAVAGLLLGSWILTELHDGPMVTADWGDTYRANGKYGFFV